jgi:hypothetical protein
MTRFSGVSGAPRNLGNAAPAEQPMVTAGKMAGA